MVSTTTVIMNSWDGTVVAQRSADAICRPGPDALANLTIHIRRGARGPRLGGYRKIRAKRRKYGTHPIQPVTIWAPGWCDGRDSDSTARHSRTQRRRSHQGAASGRDNTKLPKARRPKGYTRNQWPLEVGK